MCSSHARLNSLSEVLSFTYPKLHKGKKWYVDFYSFDPASGKMRRKKYHLDNIPTAKARRQRAGELIESLTKLLRTGWSPWVDGSKTRSYTLFEEALDKYLAWIDRMPKYKTRKTYGSRLHVLRQYNASRFLPIKYVYQFDTAFISDFLDYVYLDRETNARTRNNYKAWCQALVFYFMEKQYLTSNPVERIRNLPETAKKRQPLSVAMLRQLEQAFRASHPYFYLACMMEYYTFIRPEELCHVRLRDISVKAQSVFIPAGVSKNKRDGNVGLNDKVLKLMIDIGVFKYPSDYYLFGPRVSHPCQHRSDSEMFRRKWNRLVRKGLGWPDCYQFYSLKDSGLRDLANAEGIVIARDQARHSDISTTNKYLQGRDAPVHDETKHFQGNL